MPLVMKRIREELKLARNNGSLILDMSNEGLDGRIGSIYLSTLVIELLNKKGFVIEEARNARDWYSIIVHDPTTGVRIPCKITISGGGSDNFSNKHAILYSCTDLGIEDIPKVLSYDDMFHYVRKNVRRQRDPAEEYYMIYLHKTKPVVAVRSLCDIKYFRANPSNHLQINWNKEIKYRAEDSTMHVSPAEVFEAIRSTLAVSYDGIKRRMQVVTRRITV